MAPLGTSPRATLSSGGLAFRPATPDEAAFRADLDTAVYLDEPADPKLETIVEAIGLGVLKVRTDNDGENAPIVHLNEVLGYERVPGWLQVHKRVRGG